MSQASYLKILEGQLKNKPAKRKKFLKHSVPKKRTTGRARFPCSRCGRCGGSHMSQYGLSLCRQCFREIATQIGFIQYS